MPATMSSATTSTPQLEQFRMYIGGRFVAAASGKTFESLDPYAGTSWAEVPEGTVADVDAAVAAARAAFDGSWGQLTGFERARLLHRLGDLIAANAERLARIEVRDSGKLYREMIGQARYLPEWYHYFAGLADKLEGRAIPSDKPNFLVYTRREPVGVVAAITPWNSPLLLLTWKLAPALAGGNTVVAKPSEHSPASTLALAELVHEAGFPPGVVNVVCGSSRELGAAGVFAATGQTCMAGSRLLVHERVQAKLIRLVADRADSIRLGDPNDPETEMGPVANPPQYRKVLDYLASARAEGATFASVRGAWRPVRAADRGRRRHPGDDGRPRRDLRTGRHGAHLQHRGGGGQARQRHAVRAGRRGLDEGPPPRAPGGREAAGRHGLDQRVPGGGPQRAVRGIRGQRDGPGERDRRAERVHREQVRVGGADRRHP
jgi:(Z)-2-((N-methylformamido)methylene)-5-hydroxybutyrolactone dehydrogenase